MTTVTNTNERVERVTLADGYLHVDLLGGLRLSAPFDGHVPDDTRSRLSADVPSFDWDDLPDDPVTPS